MNKDYRKMRKHPHVRCLYETGHMREMYQLYHDYSEEMIIEFLNDINGDEFEQLLTKLIRMRNQNEFENNLK